MSQPTQRLCPVCDVAFFGGEPVLQCSGCHAVLHPACWIEADGCGNPAEHESQPLPRTFGGVPPTPPAARPAPAPPPPPPPPASAPLPERRPRNAPRNVGSLSLESRSPRQSGGLTRFWYVPVGFLVAAAVAFGIVWAVDQFRGDDGDQPAAPAAAVATATATAAATTPAATATTPAATPEPTPTPPPTEATPAGRFSTGDLVVVAGTGSCLNIRAVASIEGEILTCLADGTNLTVIEGPVEQGNLTWWLIAGPDVNGWAADLYLATR